MSAAPPDARDIAARALVRVERDGAFAAAALDAEVQRAPQLSPRDRAFATELLYGTLRVLPWLEARIDAYAKKPIGTLDPKTRAPLLLGAYQLFFARVPAFAAVDGAVEALRRAGGTHVAGFGNAVLRRLAREATERPPVLRDAIVASAAPWLREALERALGNEEALRFLEAEEPPVGLRVARPEKRAEYMEVLALARPEATFAAGRVSPLAILARGAGKPQALPGHAEGELFVQEEGSQAVALALGARPGDTVLDACAGRGNKAAILASAVGDAGAVDVCDLHESKLERLKDELRRYGLAARSAFAVDWTVGSGDVTGTYDRVLVDAPCSGVGTLRRRPDLLLRRTEASLEALTTMQLSILEHVAVHVKPGGRLVYAVCTVLREEAEEVVSRFLAARQNFALVPFDDEVLSPLAKDAPTFRLLPQLHGTDGYFLASLRAAT